MMPIILGSIALSLLHAIIPNHWLPLLMVSRKENWTLSQTTSVTLAAGSAHALSTIGIGFCVGILSYELSDHVKLFSQIVAPVLLVFLGIIFIYQHHRHKHFNLKPITPTQSKTKLIIGLVLIMFLSPCLEIEGLFIMAGMQGWKQMTILAFVYTIVTITGMTIFIRMAYMGFMRFNFHKLEHNTGIITGVILVAMGIFAFLTN
ncbi:MAG TPA: hypothetical protein PKL56_19730 [Cyclobacteriaceae bacterium]|nr:hypothetical protein [Cyclobacteriaceae bacterium]HMV10444.1 hypothetical protein [Cyclobacteriaceae bacterium]HMX01368.1 hypothetical protein [Cyclobacteriaceae bacterium]HMX50362.1 hypothetical protein [Cyclobacteriaceae bacterium]HMY92430.1 hypothetical protein [Cyclobacteriaceae bacterium]